MRFNPSFHQRPRSRRQQVPPRHALVGRAHKLRALLLQTCEKRVGAVIDILFDLAIKERQKCAVQEILERTGGEVSEKGGASPPAMTQIDVQARHPPPRGSSICGGCRTSDAASLPILTLFTSDLIDPITRGTIRLSAEGLHHARVCRRLQHKWSRGHDEPTR